MAGPPFGGLLPPEVCRPLADPPVGSQGAVMGLLAGLFGGEKEHPPLDRANPVFARIERNRETLEGFARRVQDKLEVVPGERGTYVFVGKPPKSFGIVWFHDGQESNFKILMKERGLSAAAVQILSDELRDAYVRTQRDPRYSYTIAGRKVTVTPSKALDEQVAGIIAKVSA